jgi:DNA-binding XRE family transcriptional regulator
MVTAEQLRAARAILQMDQAELAKISGVSVETIKRLERQTGKLHAKIETIIAIQKAFEAQHLEFLGDHDGRGAGVRLVHPDNLQLMREALTGELAHRVRQWLKSRCSTDPKFFERGEKRVTQALTSLSARILPTIVRSVLSEPPKGVTVAVTHADPDHYEGLLGPVSMSETERAFAYAERIKPTMLSLIADTTNLGAVRNRPFIRALAEAFPDGLTSARAKNAILAKVYGDRDMMVHITESTDDEIKTISDGLVAAAAQWLRFRTEVDAGRMRADLDLTAELTEAVKRIADIRARGQNLHEFLVQHDAICRPDNDNRAYRVNNEILFWIRQCFYEPDRRVADAQRVAQTLRTYAEEASKVTTDQRLNLGMPEVTPDEIRCRVLRRLHAA